MTHLCWKVIFSVFIYTKEINVAYACSLFVINNVFSSLVQPIHALYIMVMEYG